MHDTDAGGVEVGLGVTLRVIMIDWVMRTVEIVVEGGKVNVDTNVDAGWVIRLTTVDPGMVRVDSNVVVTVLAGS